MRRLNIFTMIFGELHISNPAFYVYNISIFIKMKVSPNGTWAFWNQNRPFELPLFKKVDFQHREGCLKSRPMLPG